MAHGSPRLRRIAHSAHSRPANGTHPPGRTHRVRWPHDPARRIAPSSSRRPARGTRRSETRGRRTRARRARVASGSSADRVRGVGAPTVTVASPRALAGDDATRRSAGARRRATPLVNTRLGGRPETDGRPLARRDRRRARRSVAASMRVAGGRNVRERDARSRVRDLPVARSRELPRLDAGGTARRDDREAGGTAADRSHRAAPEPRERLVVAARCRHASSAPEKMTAPAPRRAENTTGVAGRSAASTVAAGGSAASGPAIPTPADPEPSRSRRLRARAASNAGTPSELDVASRRPLIRNEDATPPRSSTNQRSASRSAAREILGPADQRPLRTAPALSRVSAGGGRAGPRRDALRRALQRRHRERGLPFERAPHEHRRPGDAGLDHEHANGPAHGGTATSATLSSALVSPGTAPLHAQPSAAGAGRQVLQRSPASARSSAVHWCRAVATGMPRVLQRRFRSPCPSRPSRRDVDAHIDGLAGQARRLAPSRARYERSAPPARYPAPTRDAVLGAECSVLGAALGAGARDRPTSTVAASTRRRRAGTRRCVKASDHGRDVAPSLVATTRTTGRVRAGRQETPGR